MGNKHTIYVYGTLRKGDTENLTDIKGSMYDLGWYPGIKLGKEYEDNVVRCEKLEVDDEGLKDFDRYEGYYPDDHDSSLYLRVPILDGEIYVYNHDISDRPLIDSGDWVQYKMVDA